MSTRPDQDLVFICCALRGDLRRNLARARFYVRTVLLAGQAPVCPVAGYTDCVDMTNDEEVDTGFWAGVELLKRCDQLHAFTVNGHISPGMQWEIDWWRGNRVDRPLTITNVTAEWLVQHELDLLRSARDFPREKLDAATFDSRRNTNCFYAQAFGYANNTEATAFKRRHHLWLGMSSTSLYDMMAYSMFVDLPELKAGEFTGTPLEHWAYRLSGYDTLKKAVEYVTGERDAFTVPVCELTQNLFE